MKWIGLVASGSVDAVKEKLAESGGALLNARTEENRTALHVAAGRGRAELVKWLSIQEDVDVNAVDVYGLTPLHAAVARQNYDALRALLEVDSLDFNVQAEHGETVLHKVCARGDRVALKLLLSRVEKLQVNARTRVGRTPLFLACAYGCADVAAMLLDLDGIDPEARDSSGYTPLHFSAFQGHTEVVALLLQQRNVNVNSRNNERLTPLHGAAFQGHVEVTALLLTHPDIEIDESHVEATKTPNVHRLLTRASQLRADSSSSGADSSTVPLSPRETAIIAQLAQHQIGGSPPPPPSDADALCIITSLATAAFVLRFISLFP